MGLGFASGFLAGKGGSGVKSIFNSIMPKAVESSGPIPLPQPPSAVDSASTGAEVIRKKKSTASQSIYTSPLGVSGEAQIARKTLLGQ